jgi:hypothetical protein
LLFTDPNISGFAVGSYWTVGSTSACLPIIAFCIVRPDYSATAGVIKVKHSGRLWLPDSVTSTLEGGRLSALSTSHLYPQEYPDTLIKRLSQTQAHGIVRCHTKNSQWHHQRLIPEPSNY